jgi:hypothetical protein
MVQIKGAFDRQPIVQIGGGEDRLSSKNDAMR